MAIAAQSAAAPMIHLTSNALKIAAARNAQSTLIAMIRTQLQQMFAPLAAAARTQPIIIAAMAF